MWLPERIMEEPHFYLLIEDYNEYKSFESRLDEELSLINLKIGITFLSGEPESSYLIKNAYFSSSKSTLIAENWHEAFIKFHFPKYVINQRILKKREQDNKFRFFISESDFFSSTVSTIKNYTGEVHRRIISNILLSDEVSQFGIESVISDKYIGEKESNILEIIPDSSINSLLAFYKKIQPIVDLILSLTSFAERRRLSWYKCEGVIGTKYIQNFKTRTTFYHDKIQIPLVNKLKFEKFLKTSLRGIALNDVKYITKLLRSYLSGIDYSINSQIVLWNSILERILKKHFNKKNDACKEELLRKKSVYISDLSSIKDLIDVRNDIAHGDEINSDRLFKLGHEWQILIERTLLSELKWHALIDTDVHIGMHKKI